MWAHVPASPDLRHLDWTGRPRCPMWVPCHTLPATVALVTPLRTTAPAQIQPLCGPQASSPSGQWHLFSPLRVWGPVEGRRVSVARPASQPGPGPQEGPRPRLCPLQAGVASALPAPRPRPSPAQGWGQPGTCGQVDGQPLPRPGPLPAPEAQPGGGVFTCSRAAQRGPVACAQLYDPVVRPWGCRGRMLQRPAQEEDRVILIDMAAGAEPRDTYGSTASASEVTPRTVPAPGAPHLPLPGRGLGGSLSPRAFGGGWPASIPHDPKPTPSPPQLPAPAVPSSCLVTSRERCP